MESRATFPGCSSGRRSSSAWVRQSRCSPPTTNTRSSSARVRSGRRRSIPSCRAIYASTNDFSPRERDDGGLADRRRKAGACDGAKGACVSGHSKWHSIKHKKGAADKARGKLFAKLIKQIEVAARSGGSDLEGNPTLRAAVQKARDSSVPADTIDRAIKRGTGELEGVRYEPASYEGYATGGVAVYIECLTDNRNRTGQEVKNIFTRNGGSLAEPGAVAWQFERKGVIYVERRAATEDDLMLAALDAGAEDIVDEGDTWRITTSPTDLQSVRSALEGAGIPFTSAELTMLPNQTVPLTDEATARGVLRLIDALEEHDDVQAVYANFDIPDDVLQAVVA